MDIYIIISDINVIHKIYHIYINNPILDRYLTVRKEFIDSKSAHDNEGNINFGTDIEKIGIVLGNHLEFLHNLGNLVGIVLDVSHLITEIIIGGTSKTYLFLEFD